MLITWRSDMKVPSQTLRAQVSGELSRMGSDMPIPSRVNGYSFLLVQFYVMIFGSRAVDHLRSWRDAMRPGDLLLIGMDGHMAEGHKEKLWKAYHTREDLYRKFFLNGFDHANRLIGHRLFREEDWDFCAELESQPTRHRFYFRSKKRLECAALNRVIERGEELDWFDAHKYDENSVQIMCAKAGLTVMDIWKAQGSEFREY